MVASKRAIVKDEELAKAEAILGFPPDEEPSGSKQPMAPREGWAGVLDAAALSNAHTIREKIDGVIDKAVKNQINSKLAIGRLLNEGRLLFPKIAGDDLFGLWRKEHWPTFAPRTLRTMQQMAVEFKDSAAFLEKVGWSVGVDLAGAPPVVWMAIEKKLEGGEEPTVKDVREEKAKVGAADVGRPQSGTKPPPISEADLKAQVEGARRTAPIELLTSDDRVDQALAMADPQERMEYLIDAPMDEWSKAYAFIGLQAPNGGEHASWAVKALERALSSKCHPDKEGGSHELMTYLDAQMEIIREF